MAKRCKLCLSEFTRLIVPPLICSVKIQLIEIFSGMNSFFVDQLIETLSVKRLVRFGLTVIFLALFAGLLVCLFVCFFLPFLLLFILYFLALKCLYLSYNYKVK